MNTRERRNAIMRILRNRRHETVRNLANELSVCPRTVQRDINALSLTESIYTQVGRYYGGVYMQDWQSESEFVFEKKQREMLGRILDYVERIPESPFSDDEIAVVRATFVGGDSLPDE